jgi:hypothetical protein
LPKIAVKDTKTPEKQNQHKKKKKTRQNTIKTLNNCEIDKIV